MEHLPLGKRLSTVASFAKLHAGLVLACPENRSINRNSIAHVLQDIATWLERLAEDVEQCGTCPRVRKQDEQICEAD